MLRFAPYAALFALTLAGASAQAQVHEQTQPGSQLKFHQTEQRYFPATQDQAAPQPMAPADAQPAPVMAPPPMASAPAMPSGGEPYADLRYRSDSWAYAPAQPEQPEASYIDGRQLIAELQACESLNDQSQKTYCEMRARKDAAEEADYQRRHMAPPTHYDRLAN